MADDRIDVQISVQSDGAEAGAAKASDSMTKAVLGIQQQLERLIAVSQQSSDRMAAGFSQMGQASTTNTTIINNNLARSAKVVDDFGNEVDGVSRRVATSMATVGASTGSAAAAVEQGAARAGHASAGVSRELLVLAHELSMGNYKRFGGSLMVLGEQFDFLHKLMTPTGVTLGLVAGAIAIAGLAAIHGAEQMNALQKALQLTGDYAGITAGQFMEMGDKISGDTSIKIGTVRDALAAVAASGRFTGAALEPVSVAIAKIGSISGQSGAELVEEFEKMDQGVYKWAVNYNEHFHFATQAQIEHIRALEEMGQKEEAEIETSRLVANALDDTAKRLGILPGLWHSVGIAASSAWDAMMNIGRPSTIDDQINKLKEMRNEYATEQAAQNKNYPALSFMNGSTNSKIADLDKQIAAQEKIRDTQRQQVAAAAAGQKLQEDGIKATASLDSQLKSVGGSADLANQKIAEFRANIAASVAAAKATGSAIPQATQGAIANQARIEQNIRNEYDRADKPKRPTAPRGQITTGGQSSNLQATTNAQLAVTKEGLREEEQEVERSYKAQQLTISQYYAQRLAITQKGMDAEIASVRQQLAQEQALEASAATPAARLAAKTREIEITSRLTVLEMQRADAAKTSAQEEAAATAQQTRGLQDLAAAKALSDNAQGNNRALMQAQEEVRQRRMTQQQLLALEKQQAQEQTTLEVQQIQQRLDTETELTLVQKQKLQDQIAQVQQEGQTKQLQLQIQGQQQQQQQAEQLTTNISNSFAAMFTKMAEQPKNAVQIFQQFCTSVENMLLQLASNQLMKAILGGTGSGDGTGGSTGGLGALLTTGLTALLGGSSGASTTGASSMSSLMGLMGGGSTAATAGANSYGFTMPSFAVGTPYVPNDTVAQIHAGEAIIPAHMNSSNSSVTVSNQFVLPSQIDSRTQMQIAQTAGGAIQNAVRRNG